MPLQRDFIPELSITVVRVPGREYSTESFGQSRSPYQLPNEKYYDVSLKVFSTTAPNALTIRPHTEIYWKSRRIGYVTEANQRWDNGPVVVEFKLRLSFMSRELEALLTRFEPSMLRICPKGDTLAFQKPVDEVRRVVRALRDQARSEGRLGPARYVEDEEES